MSTLLLDPLGQSILRQLHEAEEARVATRSEFGDVNTAGYWRSYHKLKHQRDEFLERWLACDALTDDFITHLTLIGSPDVDISDYIEVARQEALIHEDDRDNGRVFDAAQDIVYAYLELWKQNT